MSEARQVGTDAHKFEYTHRFIIQAVRSNPSEHVLLSRLPSTDEND